jgi:uncharacterized membrane protein YbhN (UPF0104 family)
MTRATASPLPVDSPEPAPSSQRSRFPWKKRLVATAKFFLFALVVAWIANRLAKDWTEISRYDWRPRPGWLLASGLFYLAAYLPSAYFWRLSIRWLGGAPGVFSAFKAFYVSQLGKYVPGKALVVVIRSALVANDKTKASMRFNDFCIVFFLLKIYLQSCFLLFCYKTGQLRTLGNNIIAQQLHSVKYFF